MKKIINKSYNENLIKGIPKKDIKKKLKNKDFSDIDNVYFNLGVNLYNKSLKIK